MQEINTTTAPAPLGHYSQAIVHKDLVYVSGQLGIDPNNPENNISGIREQTAQTLKNLEAVLLASGSSLDAVLKVTVYISDVSYWGDVNAVYADVFQSHKPARSAVPTKSLPKGFLVEIDAIAAVN